LVANIEGVNGVRVFERALKSSVRIMVLEYTKEMAKCNNLRRSPARDRKPWSKTVTKIEDRESMIKKSGRYGPPLDEWVRHGWIED
jgi:hypothetical protein